MKQERVSTARLEDALCNAKFLQERLEGMHELFKFACELGTWPTIEAAQGILSCSFIFSESVVENLEEYLDKLKDTEETLEKVDSENDFPNVIQLSPVRKLHTVKAETLRQESDLGEE